MAVVLGPGRPNLGGRHAAEGADLLVASRSWWRRWVLGRRGGVEEGGGETVVRVLGALDDEQAPQLEGCLRRYRLQAGGVVLVRLDRCDFVNARGFRSLLRLQGEVHLHAGHLIIIDAPRSLRIICRLVPGRLTLVPDVIANSTEVCS